MLVARREGTEIRILTSDDTPAVVFHARTPAPARPPPRPARQPEAVPVPEAGPEPVRTPETLTPGDVLCYECLGLGLGRCPCCGGRGWLPGRPGGKRRCGECGTTKACRICRGAGRLSTSNLSPYQRGYHPDLDRH